MADVPKLVTIAVTPLQRFALALTLRAPDCPKVKTIPAMAARTRLHKALGLFPITAALRAHKAGSKDLLVRDNTLLGRGALFELTDENVDALKRILEAVELSDELATEFSRLLEDIDDAQKGAYRAPDGIASYEASAEDWLPDPPKKDDELPKLILCPKCKHEFLPGEVAP
jgi:hypothetical protein